MSATCVARKTILPLWRVHAAQPPPSHALTQATRASSLGPDRTALHRNTTATRIPQHLHLATTPVLLSFPLPLPAGFGYTRIHTHTRTAFAAVAVALPLPHIGLPGRWPCPLSLSLANFHIITSHHMCADATVTPPPHTRDPHEVGARHRQLSTHRHNYPHQRYSHPMASLRTLASSF